MNKPFRLLLSPLLGLFFYLSAAAQCNSNLLTNPGFESGLTGWTTVGNVAIVTDAHSGIKAVGTTGTGYASIGQAMPTTPGTSYTASIWYKGDCWFELRFLNASWAAIPGNNVNVLSSTIYQEKTITGTAPAGAVYVYLLVSKEVNQNFKLDDACLTTGAGSACFITPNVSNIICDNNNTPSNSVDDFFSFTLNATNPVPGTGYQLFIPQVNQTHSGTYGTPLLIQYIPISTGALTLNLTDNLSANCTATTAVTPPPPCSIPGFPDLLGYVHEIIPGTNNCLTAPGQPFAVMLMQINNTGSVAATAFKLKFYFSTDNVLSASDVFWSTVNVPSLNVLNNGGPAFIGPGQPVPASLANGQYYVIVQIDTDNQVTESNEANNTIPPFTVQIGAPDVTLDSYSGIPATVAAGSSFNMQVTVKYLANGFTLPTSTSFPVNVYINDISPNIALGSVNYTLADFSQSNTVTKSVQVTVPPSVPTGSHTIRMYANTSFCEDVYLSNYKDQSVTVTTGGGGQIDLELSMVQNTANPVIYSNYTTNLTLVNKGPQAATGVKVKWMKPTGVVYTGGNEFTASQGSFNPNGDQIWTVGSIPANGSATLMVSYFLLQNGAPITYAQVTAANETDVDSQPNNGTSPTVNEDDEANSGGSAPPVLTPDLTIADLQIPTLSVAAGAILSYNFDASNVGTAAVSGNFTIKSYISTNQTLSANDTQDGTIPTGNYGVGFSAQNVAGASTIPAGLAAGNYYLIVKIDADGVVAEGNESNNTVVMPFTVTGGGDNLPDLAFAGANNMIDAPAQVAKNNLFRGDFGFTNIGTANAGSMEVGLYLSTDAIFSPATDVLLGVNDFTLSTFAGLGAGGTVENLSIPSTVATGNYKLIAVLDHTNLITELNETNNTKFKDITVLATGTPDLVVENFGVVPATVATGGGFTNLSFSVLNRGTAQAAGLVGSRLLLSTNATPDASDLVLENFSANGFYGAIVINNGFGHGVTATIPVTVTAGNYYLIAWTDANGQFAEISETNNYIARPIEITGGSSSCAAITTTPGPSQITIAGFSAPHVLIKVFNPNWTLAFQCLDNCANPLVVSGLNAGTYHVQVKLINSGWGDICYLQQDVSVSDLGNGNGGTALLIPDDRFRLAFDKFYPNPASHWLNVVLFSPKEQAVTLDFYNQQGRRVHTLEVQLEEGRNTLELEVSDWKSGTYNVIARGEGLPAYGRFLKVWEE